MFIDKVQAVENKFIDLEQRISDPSVIARQDEWQKLTKEHASLAPIIETFRKYKDCLLYTSPSPRDTERSRMPSSA